MKTETQIRKQISDYEQVINDMNKSLITPYHPRLGKAQLLHQKEYAEKIRTLYEDVLDEKLTGIARTVLYS